MVYTSRGRRAGTRRACAPGSRHEVTAWLRPGVLCLLCSAFITLPAASGTAQEDRPFRLFVGQGAKSDTNIFRLPDKVQPNVPRAGVDSASRRDAALSTYVGLAFEKAYERQRVRTDMRITRNSYGTYTQLNSNDVAAFLGWDSEIGKRWTGAVGYQRLQTPINDVNQTGFRTVRRIDQRVNAALDYRWTLAWSSGVRLTKVSNDYNDPFNPFSDLRALVTDAHLLLRSRRGNQLRALVRTTDGSYSLGNLSQRGIATQAYRQVDYEADTKLTGTGRTGLAGGVGYSKFDFEAVAPGFQNFSGPTGYLTYDWSHNGKTSINLDLRREIAPEPMFYAFTSAVASSSATAAVTLTLSPRFNLRGATGFRRQRFALRTDTVTVTEPTPADPTGETQPEPAVRVTTTSFVPTANYVQVSFTGTWTPRPPLSLSTGIAHETRSGNSALLPYPDVTVFTNLHIQLR